MMVALLDSNLILHVSTVSLVFVTTHAQFEITLKRSLAGSEVMIELLCKRNSYMCTSVSARGVSNFPDRMTPQSLAPKRVK